MKPKRFLSAALAMLLVLSAAGLSACGKDETSTRGAYVRVSETEGFAPLRKKPKDSAEILANLPADAEISLFRKAKDGWYEVEWNGIGGYLAERYITYTAHTEIWETTTTGSETSTGTTLSTVKLTETGTTGLSSAASAKTSVWTKTTLSTTSTTLRTSKTHVVTVTKPTPTAPPVTVTQAPASVTPAPSSATQAPELPQTETTAALTPHVGAVIPFGRFEQDGNWNNGMEEIQWIVIGETAEGYLLLSQQALTVQPYHTENTAVTWESSSLRGYLNGDFLYDAFNAEERARISVTSVINENNPVSGVSGGSNTLDHVFLLSLGETESYLAQSALHGAEATAYARTKGAQTDENGLVQWWLRSPGGTESSAAVIPYGEAASTEGVAVSTNLAVRPCLIMKKH